VIGLGLRLSTNGGREGWTRLVAIGGGVAIGTLLLLSVVSGLQILQTVSDKACWQCSIPNDITENTQIPTDTLLWHQGRDYFDGKQIDRFDLAPTGPGAPTIPGIGRAVQPGEYFASPALIKLLRTAPDNQLADRYPGSLAGEIGTEGLESPADLVIVSGYEPDTLQQAKPHVGYLAQLDSKPRSRDYPLALILMFLVVVGGLLFAIGSLVMAATRLGAARREEKFATLRLFGATPRQIMRIAAVDAALGAAIGIAVASALFYALQPLASARLASFADMYPEEFTPGLFGLVMVIGGVLMVSIVASLLSLRRVRISPLGVSRKTTPKPPGLWRVLPLVLGFGIMIGVWVVNKDIVDTVEKDELTKVFVAGFGIALLGLALAGPWLTLQCTRLFAKVATSASGLLAARRLADNPKAAYRSISVLVIAAFLATLVATFAPLIRQDGMAGQGQQHTIQHTYFLDDYFVGRGGLRLQEAKQALEDLRAIPGVTAVTWFTPAIDTSGDIFNREAFMRCADLGGKTYSHHSLCAGATDPNTVVHVPAGSREAAYTFEPQVPSIATIMNTDISNMPVQSMELIVDDNRAAVDRMRTVLARYPLVFRDNFGFMTWRELNLHTKTVADGVERAIQGILVLILLVAGCSLAVSVGGSIVERKRPFGLLRVAGMSVRQLRRVVLYESVVPLVGAIILSSGLGFLVGALLIESFAHPRDPVTVPGLGFWIIIGLGIVLALLVILATLPLLNALTKPEKARFE
jgi:ABC-type lipoprotein release transport system permease subunit